MSIFKDGELNNKEDVRIVFGSVDGEGSCVYEGAIMNNKSDSNSNNNNNNSNSNSNNNGHNNNNDHNNINNNNNTKST